ncbi:MAG: hypothetical protein E7598_08050 [Ruminococcaceae bacterium]|nr:hypothetical protein [Oscillospiraceae bacterium]
MKKLLTLFVLLFLLSGFTVFAAEATVLDVAGTLSAEDKTVTVEISIDAAEAFCGCSFNLVYDNEVLDIVSVTGGDVVKSATAIINDSYAENSIRVVSASAVELPKSGNIITAVFSYEKIDKKSVAFEIENCKIMGVDSSKISHKINNTATIVFEVEDNETTTEATTEITTESTTTGGTSKPSGGTSKPSGGNKPDKDKEEVTTTAKQETPAAPEEDPEVFLMSFDDVSEKDWFYDSVKYAYEQKLMNGTGENEFSPNTGLTRAMLVTILYRVEKEPRCEIAQFADVAKDTWYTNSVSWASENGIVKGVGDGKFAPDANITREQIALILYNYAKLKGNAVAAAADLSVYSDAASVSSWATDAVKWAVGEGIIKGRSASTLESQGHATRAEAATMLVRYLEYIK